MKLAFAPLCVTLFLVSCQKKLTSELEATTTVVASNANSPLKSHTLSLTTDYPVKPGEVPPFSFSKTLYPDHRVKTLRMLSRKYPIHPAYPKQAIELIGSFTYRANPNNPDPNGPIPNWAYLKGTSETWEYYKTSTGAAAKRSLGKKVINWVITIDKQGAAQTVFDSTFATSYETLGKILFLRGSFESFTLAYDESGNQIYDNFGYLQYDQFGNLTGFQQRYSGKDVERAGDASFAFTYDYNNPRGSRNYSYIPTQNLLCQEFSVMEVMQWIPQPTHARKSGSGIFMLPNGTRVVQSQTYKNYQFDANGNQISVTYGDNVLQKTTWDVQP